MARTKQSRPRRVVVLANSSRTAIGGRRQNFNSRASTKRGAYKPANKRAMRNRMRPFTEQKTNSGEEVAVDIGVTELTPVVDDIVNPMTSVTLSRIAASNYFWNWSYLNFRQGVLERTIIGKSIYVNYLKQKFQIALPQGPYMIKHPANVYLIHGWCKAPVHKTYYTTPSDTNFSRGDMMEHITDQVNMYYDQRKDKLRFRQKVTSNIQILGFQKIRAPKDNNLGVQSNTVVVSYDPTTATETRGTHALINMSCTWTVKRKIHLTPGKDNSGLPYQFLYPNDSWLPFSLIYNPTFADYTNALESDQDARYRISVMSNNQVWFTDS